MFADAGPSVSGGALAGGVAVPPNSTGTCAEYPGSPLSEVVREGVVVPYQLPLKFFGFVPGAGNEPPDCRSTTWPYQLPEMSLSVSVELAALCTGEFVPPLPSRNTMPSVQLFVIELFSTVVLSVWLRKMIPVRLSSITFCVIELPLLLLTSIAVRLPVNVEFETETVFPWPCTASPAVFSGSFQVVESLPSRVIVKPDTTTPLAPTWIVAEPPPDGPLIVVTS